MTDLANIKTQKLTKEDISRLYQNVNREGDWQININSDFQLVSKIIELWFEEQGYDFWHNPFPSVEEFCVTKDKEIEFKYVTK